MTAPVQINHTIGLKGQYKLVRRKGILQEDGSYLPGEVIEETGWCKNIITSAGIDKFLNNTSGNSNMFIAAAVGAGNTTPSLSDTTLASFIGGTYRTQAHTITRQYTTIPYYIKWSYTFRFLPGSATGNIAEMGVCFTTNASTTPTSTTTVHSRALVVDSGGTPTTVTIQADEYLDMTWEFFMYPGEASGSFNMTIDGVSTPFNYVSKPLRLDGNTYNGAAPSGGAWPDGPFNAGSWSAMVHFAPVTSTNTTGRYTYAVNGVLSTSPTTNPTSNSSDSNVANSAAWKTFTSGVGYHDADFTWGLNNSNLNINLFCFHFVGGSFQMSIDPPVAKVSTKTFTITVRLSMANLP